MITTTSQVSTVLTTPYTVRVVMEDGTDYEFSTEGAKWFANLLVAAVANSQLKRIAYQERCMSDTDIEIREVDEQWSDEHWREES